MSDSLKPKGDPKIFTGGNPGYRPAPVSLDPGSKGGDPPAVVPPTPAPPPEPPPSPPPAPLESS